MQQPSIFVFRSISMGNVSQKQGGSETACTSRFKRNVPTVALYHRESSRSQHSRQAADKAGAIYIMDRGYLDYARLYRLHQSAAYFVTHSKRFQVRSMSLSEDRQNNRSEIRPSDNPTRLLRQKSIPKAQAYCLLRQDPREQLVSWPTTTPYRLWPSRNLSQTVAESGRLFSNGSSSTAKDKAFGTSGERGQS